MAIIKEKSFIISSVIENLSDDGLVSGEPERTETKADGFLKIDGEKYIISYSENTEGGRVVCDITVDGESVTVSRRGAIVSDLCFSEGRTQSSKYEIPPYSFDMTVTTKRIRIALDRCGGRVNIHYDMNIGGQTRRVRMKILTCP